MELLEQVVVVLSALTTLVAVAVLVFVVRAVLLVRHGGAFDCSWRCVTGSSGVRSGAGELGGSAPSRWALGVAHVGSDALEWWRVFSLSPRPRSTWHRTGLEVLERRSPDAGEAPVLFTGAMVVRCAQRGDGAQAPGQDFELAMSPDAYTGFASWLESSPPRDRGGVV